MIEDYFHLFTAVRFEDFVAVTYQLDRWECTRDGIAECEGCPGYCVTQVTYTPEQFKQKYPHFHPAIHPTAYKAVGISNEEAPVVKQSTLF